MASTLTDPTWHDPARSVDRVMVEAFCKLAGSKLRAEPEPMQAQEDSYRQLTYCITSQVVLVHSWTNGDRSRPDSLR